jgi:L-serine dehydratase
MVDFKAKMAKMWHTMLNVSSEYSGDEQSWSGLVGGDARRLLEASPSLSGEFMTEVMAEALKQAESNACMRVIVAAPTAGSCGVMPAVLIPLHRAGAKEDDIINALTVAAGVGQVIARKASISGAEGGCQAEIGSASAMAAAAVVMLEGGSPQQMAHALAMALKNLLGLVCDPVAGLVEVPCVKRNVIGAVNAISCAQMALAGIESRIPADEVIDAMRRIGNLMSPTLRETGQGGLAATPTGCAISKKLFHNEE